MNQCISIIIPVFNVADYLPRCVDSLLHQTYRNIEIILVNDGSTDNSGVICDEYAEKDDRVKVIHKENSGSSDSRNMGIDSARGDYLMFVDSDDFMNRFGVERLLAVVLDAGADIAVSGYEMVHEGEMVDVSKRPGMGNLEVFDTEGALSKLMYQTGITNSPWAKIYKRETFGDIKYPSGKINQDLGTTYKVFARADRVAVVSDSLYYYFQRKDSVVNSPFSLKRMAGLEFAREQVEFMTDSFPALQRAADHRLFTEAVSIFLKISDSSNEQDFSQEKDECWAVIREHRRRTLLDDRSRLQPRMSALASYAGRRLFAKVGLFVKKKVEKKL